MNTSHPSNRKDKQEKKTLKKKQAIQREIEKDGYWKKIDNGIDKIHYKFIRNG